MYHRQDYVTVRLRYAWLWVDAVKAIRRQILGVYIPRSGNVIVAESFLGFLIKSWES